MKKEWKKKASFEYRIPNIFCTFKLFIGNKYKILLPTPVFIICTSNNGNIYTPNETANTDIDECIELILTMLHSQQIQYQLIA